METPLYQIVDWNRHFENSRSRVVENCQYVCVPNRHGGVGYRSLMCELDGFAIYGAWVSIVELCSRQKERNGWLTQNGKELGRRLSAADLSRTFGRPIDEIYRVFQVLTLSDIAWIKLIDGTPEYDQADYRPPYNFGRENGKSQDIKVPNINPFTSSADWLAKCSIGKVEQPGEKQKRIDRAQRIISDVQLTSDCRRSASDVGVTPDCRRSDVGVTSIKTPNAQTVSGDVGVTSDCRPTAEERRKEVQKDHSITVPTTTVRGGDSKKITEEDKAELAEGEAWINSLFPNSEAWTYEELRLLHDLLPIKPESQRLISWAHKLPTDHRFHDLTKLKQSRLFLLREFGAEVDKIRNVRKQLGLNDDPKPIVRLTA